MAYEDFTTYTEVDSGTYLTVATNKATGVDIPGNVDVYLYKDFTADYFNALDVDWTGYIEDESSTNRYGLGGPAFANVVGELGDLENTDFISCAQSRGSSVAWIRIIRGNDVASDWYVGSTETIYYFTISRAAGNDTVNLYVYSDSARTSLLDTVSVSGFGTAKWRYVYGVMTYNSALSARLWSGYIENMDLNEAIAGTNMKINIGDTWKTISGAKINIGDSWKTVSKIKQNIGDTWKTVF